MENKKGQVLTYSTIIIFFFLVASIIFFISYIMFTMGNDYIAVPVVNMSTQLNYSAQFVQAFDDVGNNYHDTNLSFFDYIFIIAFIITVGIGLYGSYKARSLNYFSWLWSLIYGNMVLLLLLGVSLLYTNWFLNLITLIMPNLNVQLPITYYIIDHAGIIFLGISCVFLLLNIIDLDFLTIINRKKKEQDILNDEIL